MTLSFEKEDILLFMNKLNSIPGTLISIPNDLIRFCFSRFHLDNQVLIEKFVDDFRGCLRGENDLRKFDYLPESHAEFKEMILQILTSNKIIPLSDSSFRPVITNIRAEKGSFNESRDGIILNFDYISDKNDKQNRETEDERLSTIRVVLNEEEKTELKEKIDKLKMKLFDSLKN